MDTHAPFYWQQDILKLMMERSSGTIRYWRNTKPFEVYFGLRQIWDETPRAKDWRGQCSENYMKDLVASYLEMNAMSCWSRVKNYFREVRSSWTDLKSSWSRIFYTRYGTDWRFSLRSWYSGMFPAGGSGWVNLIQQFQHRDMWSSEFDSSIMVWRISQRSNGKYLGT